MTHLPLLPFKRFAGILLLFGCFSDKNQAGLFCSCFVRLKVTDSLHEISQQPFSRSRGSLLRLTGRVAKTAESLVLAEGSC